MGKNHAACKGVSRPRVMIEMGKTINIAARLRETAAKLGDRVAVSVPAGRASDGKISYREYTFRELELVSDEYARGLARMGVGRGVRALLMVRPGFEFIALSFALYKTGAVTVLIDPGMGKINLLNCVRQVEPEAFVAIPKAHFARLVYPGYFKSVKYFITVGRRWLWGGATHNQLKIASPDPFDIAATEADETASILFTTGSTGPPKGVVYTHGIFDAQVDMIRQQYGITDDDVDLPAFPLFALFSIAMGMRVVIPDMDPTRPASVDPAKYAAAINQQGVTFSFGSPAIWRKVSAWLAERGMKLPTLRRVLMAGAPVANEIHERLLNGILPEGAATHTPFGATEVLPLCDITGREILDETAERAKKGEGVCVGRSLPGMRVRVIKISDDPVAEWDDALTVPNGEIGEIVASGPVVTKEYYRLPAQTALAKIYESRTGVVWHRMGDVGYMDEKGRLWFCGRKGHRVVTSGGTFFTIMVEAIFNNHPAVLRSALVGLGAYPAQEPVIIIELDKKWRTTDHAKTTLELLELAKRNPMPAAIKRVLYHDGFPTDIRHNAKIFREKLKIWAETQTGFGG